jgi:SAM-dependent methyltransferase
MTIGQRVQEHYGMFAQRDVILAGLRAAGKNIDALTVADLAPFDQLHTCGRTATLQLLDLLGAGANDHVLDVGCGIGGPARLLSDTVGCRVTGVDLTEGFIETARDFAQRCGLAARTTFIAASATDMPVESNSFDGAWHIHMSMNVPDKAAMYREIYRALKPGGRFVLYDPILGASAAPVFPVPWSKTGDTSFLVTRTDMLNLICAPGFELHSEADVTGEGIAWLADAERQRLSNTATAPPTAIRDPMFLEMSSNHRTNLSTGAVMLWRAVFQKA